MGYRKTEHENPVAASCLGERREQRRAGSSFPVTLQRFRVIRLISTSLFIFKVFYCSLKFE